MRTATRFALIITIFFGLVTASSAQSVMKQCDINRRLTNLLDWLREAEPDIVCLQELKCGDTEFPAETIRQAGYHAVCRGERRWNGVAILAQWAPVVTRMDLPGDAPDGQCRYLEAAINGVLVASIYSHSNFGFHPPATAVFAACHPRSAGSDLDKIEGCLGKSDDTFNRVGLCNRMARAAPRHSWRCRVTNASGVGERTFGDRRQEHVGAARR
jgi:hypothetical protein